MAQASAISNSIRQLGGSLGVAILATTLTTRVSFHNQNYGENINQHSVVFQQTIGKLRNHVQHDAGSSPLVSGRQSQFLLLSNLNKQSYIEGINDDFLLAGIITFLGVIPVAFLHTKKSKIKKTPENG
jgi:DHA2 family multidrug resistance protein